MLILLKNYKTILIHDDSLEQWIDRFRLTKEMLLKSPRCYCKRLITEGSKKMWWVLSFNNAKLG